MRGVRNIFQWLVVVIAVFAIGQVEAQIRIISQSQIDSVKNPSTVADRAMEFRGGNNISFGSIAEESGVWVKSIEWQNESDKTLVVTRVSSSCSCLKADIDRAPVKAGGKGSVTLRYDPRNRSGRVSQRVMIYTNLSDKLPTAVLNLEGEVRPMADRSGDYPYLRGALALRRDTVRLQRGIEMRLACMNVGKSPLRVVADTLLSSRGIEMHTEPRELNAGEEGDMVICYNPKAAVDQKILRLYIGGLQLPPRQRCLIIEVKE